MTTTIEEIITEMDAYNEMIGAGTRSRDRARRDAEWVKNAREGLDTETLCMILTDYEFGLRGKSDLLAELTNLIALIDQGEIGPTSAKKTAAARLAIARATAPDAKGGTP